jgi:hypothetical protein
MKICKIILKLSFAKEFTKTKKGKPSGQNEMKFAQFNRCVYFDLLEFQIWVSQTSNFQENLSKFWSNIQKSKSSEWVLEKFKILNATYGVLHVV